MAAITKLAVGLTTMLLGAASLAAAQQKSDKPAAAPSQAAQLPGGASSLTETHGDWVVNCRVANVGRVCTYSFQQFDRGSNQRAFAIELTPRKADAGGTLALPFGLDIAKGVTLAIDDKTIQEGLLPFSTCLVVGCLVPITFDAAVQAQLKAGTVLKVTGTILESAQPVSFNIPLNGFASASARTTQLLDN
jgi:invasion protein IalB